MHSIRYVAILTATIVVILSAQSVHAVTQYKLTTLVSFDGANGANPFAGLIADASGNLYGTTGYGGANDDGTVFKLAADTHTLTTLATFDGTNGALPAAGLIADASGNLYGTTNVGGTNGRGGHGTVFQLAAGTHVLTTLAAFDGTNGARPEAGLIADASGNLYGTTTGVATNGHGTVFKLAAGTHALTTLATFNGTNGTRPSGDLLADASGNLYGTTYAGGANSEGTVFQLAAGTHALTTLATFNGTNGAGLRGNLIADASGNLYGTTGFGGAHGFGTVFKLSPVPEPASIQLLLMSFAFAAASRRRSRHVFAISKAVPLTVAATILAIALAASASGAVLTFDQFTDPDKTLRIPNDLLANQSYGDNITDFSTTPRPWEANMSTTALPAD